MTSLLGLIEEHPIELEASLRSEYGNDCKLIQVFTGEMTFRELRVLIRGLPQNSMLKYKISGGSDDERWSVDTYIHASMHDFLVNMFALEFYKAGKKPPFNVHDVHIPRPGQRKSTDLESNENAKALLALMRGDRAKPDEFNSELVTIDTSRVTFTEAVTKTITHEGT